MPNYPIPAEIRDAINSFTERFRVKVTEHARAVIAVELDGLIEPAAERIRRPREHLTKVRSGLVKALPGLLWLASGHAYMVDIPWSYYPTWRNPPLRLRFVDDMQQSIDALHNLTPAQRVLLQQSFGEGAEQWAAWLETIGRSDPFAELTAAEVFHFQHYFHRWLSTLVWEPPG